MNSRRSDTPAGLSNRDPIDRGLKGFWISFKKIQLKRYFWLFLLPTAAAFFMGFLWPFIRGIYLSFCEFRNIKNARFVGLENYVRALSDPGFVRSFLYTVAFTVISVVLVCRCIRAYPRNKGIQSFQNRVLHAQPYRGDSSWLYLAADYQRCSSVVCG